MKAQAEQGERLEDYAVDLGPLKEVHEQIVAKRSEIEALVAADRNLGPLDAMNDVDYEDLRTDVERRLEEWEKAKLKEGFVRHPDTPFNRLAQELFVLEQQILDAEDEQVEEATERPFDKPLR